MHPRHRVNYRGGFATEKNEFVSLPEILTVHLMRFGAVGTKLHSKLSFGQVSSCFVMFRRKIWSMATVHIIEAYSDCAPQYLTHTSSLLLLPTLDIGCGCIRPRMQFWNYSLQF